MDAFYSTSSSSSGPYGAAAYGGAGWGYDSLKDFSQITPAVQTHLKLVRTATLPFALLLLLVVLAFLARRPGPTPVFLCIVAGLIGFVGGGMWQRILFVLLKR